MIHVTFFFQTHELVPQGIGYQEYANEEEMKLDLKTFLFSENQKHNLAFDFNTMERKNISKRLNIPLDKLIYNIRDLKINKYSK